MSIFCFQIFLYFCYKVSSFFPLFWHKPNSSIFLEVAHDPCIHSKYHFPGVFNLFEIERLHVVSLAVSDVAQQLGVILQVEEDGCGREVQGLPRVGQGGAPGIRLKLGVGLEGKREVLADPVETVLILEISPKKNLKKIFFYSSLLYLINSVFQS